MDSILRDIDREQSKMQTDVSNLYRHYEQMQGYVRLHLQQTTMEWAKLVASHPKTLLLVVETTRIVDDNGYAYSGENEPIRFTSLSLASGRMWDQLVKPTHSKGIQGTEYHSLTLADVKDKPTINEAWSNIVETLDNHHIIIFGADWARKAIQSVVSTELLDNAFCLHNKCKEYYGEFYELSLEKVLSYQGIDKKRDELKNSQDRLLMLAQVVNNLAIGMIKQSQDSENSNLGEIDEQPF